MNDDLLKNETLSPEVKDAIFNYASAKEELSKKQIMAGVAMIVFIVFSIICYFTEFGKEMTAATYGLLGILIVWCLCLVIITPFHLREKRIKLYKVICDNVSSLSIEEVADYCDIKSWQLQEDLEFCSKHCIIPNNYTIIPCEETVESLNVEPSTEPTVESQVIVLVKELKVINENISNSELHAELTILTKLLQDSEKVLQNRGTDFLDFYVAQLPNILVKYIDLQKETPDGYKDLLKFLSIIKNTINEFSAEDAFQKEIDFSTDVQALLTSAQLAGLASEKITKFTDKNLENLKVDGGSL